MFGRMMNSFYYGKSGKGDFKKEDLPENRWQLFWDVLRTRFSGLCRLNLMYMIIWIPAMVVIGMTFMNVLQNSYVIMAAQQGSLQEYIDSMTEEGETATVITAEEEAAIAETDISEYIDSSIFTLLLWLVPCIAITGPCTAGVSYVTRNWARDEHAFIWSDFKDAVKANWKQAIVTSLITGLLPLVAYVCWKFYGSLAATQTFMVIPQMLIMILCVIWAIGVTYMYPLEITYDLKMGGVLRNGLLLGIARLPMSVGIRLLHCVPMIICALLCYFWQPVYGILILGAYYLLIGFSLSRFITASFTNGVFEKYINPRIQGAPVNQGLRTPEDEEEDEAESTESTEQ